MDVRVGSAVGQSPALLRSDAEVRPVAHLITGQAHLSRPAGVSTGLESDCIKTGADAGSAHNPSPLALCIKTARGLLAKVSCYNLSPFPSAMGCRVAEKIVNR